MITTIMITYDVIPTNIIFGVAQLLTAAIPMMSDPIPMMSDAILIQTVRRLSSTRVMLTSPIVKLLPTMRANMWTLWRRNRR